MRLWQSLALLFGLICPTPVFGEINGCYCKQLSFFFFKPFFCWFLTFLTCSASSLSLSLLSFPYFPLCRLIAWWYRMLRTAASFHTQLFESRVVSRILLLGPHLPLLMHSLVTSPGLLQVSSSCPSPLSLICLPSAEFSLPALNDVASFGFVITISAAGMTILTCFIW